MAEVAPAGYLKQPCLLEFNNNHKLKRLTVVQYSDSSYFPNLNCLFPIPDGTTTCSLSARTSLVSGYSMFCVEYCRTQETCWELQHGKSIKLSWPCSVCLWLLVGDTRYSQRVDQQHSLLQCTGDKFLMQLNSGVLTTRRERVWVQDAIVSEHGLLVCLSY